MFRHKLLDHATFDFSYTSRCASDYIACATVKHIVKVHCKLHFVDSIEEVGCSAVTTILTAVFRL